MCAVIAPLFERGFIDHTYANRVGKGTHRAVSRYERHRERYRFVLRGDIYRYFPAIDHEVLKADLRRRIACRRTLAVLDLNRHVWKLLAAVGVALMAYAWAGEERFNQTVTNRRPEWCSGMRSGEASRCVARVRTRETMRGMNASPVVAVLFPASRPNNRGELS